MNDQMHHEVISAFIDNEPFEARELASALATPEGRELLLDLISLRHVVIADGTSASASSVAKPRLPWRGLAAAAAIVLALGGGYVAGHRTASDARTASAKNPPAPTRVIEIDTWQPREGGR